MDCEQRLFGPDTFGDPAVNQWDREESLRTGQLALIQNSLSSSLGGISEQSRSFLFEMLKGINCRILKVSSDDILFDNGNELSLGLETSLQIAIRDEENLTYRDPGDVYSYINHTDDTEQATNLLLRVLCPSLDLEVKISKIEIFEKGKLAEEQEKALCDFDSDIIHFATSISGVFVSYRFVDESDPLSYDVVIESAFGFQ